MKPASIISLIVAVFIVVGGIITCNVAQKMAAESGQSIFSEIESGENNIRLFEFGDAKINKILLDLEDAEVTVIGGAEKLFKFFVEHYQPESIVSYCDLSKFSGQVYEKLGFKKARTSGVAKHWYNLKTKQHITDNLLRQRGFDQLFKTNYGKGTSNETLMLEAGFVEVYDCGQATYVWHNN